MDGSPDKYELLERIAVGGMAEIFKARARGAHGFEKVVVVKRILPDLAADPKFVEMFIDEARITAQLEHPKIVQVFELGADADDLFIAMQYVDGLDVLSMMRECATTQMPLPYVIAVYIMREILDALDYAHTARGADGRALRIIHRDISPGNVLVSRRGDVKLTDFGIAHAAEKRHTTESGILKGKYGYMSPEQVAGFEIDARSDLFSVGTLLAEMLMGRRLFMAAADLDILLMVRDANLERLDKHGAAIPPALQRVLRQALQRDPADRFATAAAFRDALDEWIDDQPDRVGPRDLAAFLAELDHAAPGERSAEASEFATLSGPSTRIHAEEADRAVAEARAAYRASTRDEHDAVPPVVEDETSSDLEMRPTEQGDLRAESPMRVLFRRARGLERGRLMFEGRAGILKEVYLDEGHPVFVASNVESERIGQYLVARGAISEAELRRAVAALPHFRGRLVDTLAGLGLIDPLEAYRHLARQVRDKLASVCAWRKGSYRWYAGAENPFPVRPLRLDTFQVLGAGAIALPAQLIDGWCSDHATRIPRTGFGGFDLERFGLGAATERVASLLDGRTAVIELARRFRSEGARANFLRILVLLVECEIAQLDERG